MLDKLFLSVLNMSLVASYVIILVLLARLVFKKTPKIFSYALWGVVLLRLLCPLSFESALSLIPVAKQPIPQDIIYSQAPQISTGMAVIDNVINPILPIPTDIGASINPIQIWLFIGEIIWILGIVVMAIYSVISYRKLKRSLATSTPVKDNIYLTDHISTAFVLGMIRPKIYIPSSLLENEQKYIIAHELCHIKRLDHITRMLGFIALSLHWFNPLVWIAFVLSGKDMELSCDEAVMKNMDTDIRAEYSQSLLQFSAHKKIIHATPLAFGEGDTKERIENVLNYKKPRFWVVLVAIIAVFSFGIGFATNQKISREFPMTGNYLSDLEPFEITKTIGKLVDEDPSALYLPPDNFGLVVSKDFTFVKSGAVKFLYDMRGANCKESQLRVFNEENNFFITEPTNCLAPKEQIFQLYSFLEALKYLPTNEIAALCGTPADRYAIELSRNDRKYNEGRQIYYNKQGVIEEGDWLICLDIQPLYGTGSTDFHGIGNDIIHVYYSEAESYYANNKTLSHDQAVIKALSDTVNRYLDEECFGEGHIVLGTEKDGDITKIYTLTMVGYYGFVNNNFEKNSGTGIIPAVVTLKNNNEVDIKYPKDGSGYASSVKEMFPLKYHNRIFGENDSDRKNLTEQEWVYAKEYLSKIGRKADIGDYRDFEHILLADLGVSVEVSNRLEDFYKVHSYYPYFIGTKEIIEDGVRMVYEMSYHENQKEIKFTKYTYDTKEVVKQFVFNSITGEEINQ